MLALPATRALAHRVIDPIWSGNMIDVAAQLSYWNVLALFPFAIVALSLIAYLPLRGLDSALMSLVRESVPPDIARLYEQVMAEVIGKQHGVLLVLALLAALWTASGSVSALIAALDEAWEVKETRSYWRRKGVALGVTAAAVLVVIVVCAALLVGSEFGGQLLARMGWAPGPVVSGFLRWVVAYVAMLGLASVAYMVLPNIEGRRYVLPGALFASGVWVVVSLGFGLYVQHIASYARVYGALGGAIVLLTWLYLAGLVLLVGGRLNAMLMESAEHGAGATT